MIFFSWPQETDAKTSRAEITKENVGIRILLADRIFLPPPLNSH
jgi:hypothetical protein